MKIALVIPCFNEAARLNVAVFSDYLAHSDTQIIFVNDGSTDETAVVLEKLCRAYPERSRAVTLDGNSGKAEAVRQGILAAVADGAELAGYLDADLSVGLQEFDKLCREIGDYRMIFGSRIRVLNSHISRNWPRHYLSRVFATMASIALGFQIYDTQCGAKVFERQLAQELFAQPFESRWLFDVEIFFRLKALGDPSKLACELPLINWQAKHGSKTNPKVFINAPLELWRIRKKYG